MHEDEPAAVVVKQGRRDSDWVMRFFNFAVAQSNSILEIWKDDRSQRWSTRRILLWLWTWLGAWCVYLEMTARVYVVRETIITPHFLNNAWIQAWMVTEGAFIVAVFGPVMVDYFKSVAPGVAAIGGALRDNVVEPVVIARRKKAADAGSDGTEYNE